MRKIHYFLDAEDKAYTEFPFDFTLNNNSFSAGKRACFYICDFYIL